MKFQSYDSTLPNIDSLNQELYLGNHVFMLIYKNGCGPCNRAKPEWYALKSVLEDKYKTRNDVAIVDVEAKHVPTIKDIGIVSRVPTFKYIHKKTLRQEDYVGGRSTNDLVKWIESKI